MALSAPFEWDTQIIHTSILLVIMVTWPSLDRCLQKIVGKYSILVESIVNRTIEIVDNKLRIHAYFQCDCWKRLIILGTLMITHLWSPLQSHNSISMLLLLPFTFRLESSNSTILTPWVGLGVSASSILMDSDKKFATDVLPLCNNNNHTIDYVSICNKWNVIKQSR